MIGGQGDVKKKDFGILKNPEYSRPSAANTVRKKTVVQWWDIRVRNFPERQTFFLVFFSLFMTIVNSTVYIRNIFSYSSGLSLYGIGASSV